MQALSNFRIVIAIVGGIVSGVLGYDGLSGFLVFLLYSILGSCFFCFKLRKDLNFYYSSYTDVLKTWKSGMMEYILTWIMIYNIIYVLA